MSFPGTEPCAVVCVAFPAEVVVVVGREPPIAESTAEIVDRGGLGTAVPTGTNAAVTS